MLAVDEDELARALVAAGQQGAEHHGVSASDESLGDVTGILQATVTDNWNTSRTGCPSICVDLCHLRDANAARGLAQLKMVDGFIARRNELAERYRDLLRHLPLGLPPEAPDGTVHGYHLFPILVPERRRIYDGLRAAGIGVQVHYVPIHHHPISADIGLKPGELPHCDGLYERLLSLPIYPSLTESQQDTVVEELSRLLRQGT